MLDFSYLTRFFRIHILYLKTWLNATPICFFLGSIRNLDLCEDSFVNKRKLFIVYVFFVAFILEQWMR